jgi:hypothetical protein
MRNLGGILLLAGILGFFYASSRLSDLGSAPASEELSVGELAHNPAARWQIVRYACGGIGLMGLLLALYPKGR